MKPKIFLSFFLTIICCLSAYSATTSERGPEWLDGTWEYNGYIDTFMGRLYVNTTLTIDWKNQTLLAKSNGNIDARGKYEVYDGAIHSEKYQLYFNIDYKNHRIEYGNGIYLNKVGKSKK